MSLFESASLVVTPNGTKASKLYAVKPVDGSGDLTVTRATTATRVNSAGLIESVASNVPRLDYTNSTCPSILVEPQRTNVITNSNDFSNANWTDDGTTTKTPNSGISPDGTQNAIKITSNGGYNYKILPVLSAGTYTYSIYVKASASVNINIVINDIGGSGGTTKNIAVTTNWQRFNITKNVTLGTFVIIDYSSLQSGFDFYFYGAQVELSSYPTSYIPTTSASVTRNADIISKTGISSLIGQTEGTIFFDLEDYIELDIPCLTIDNGTNDNRIVLFRESGTGYLGLFLVSSGTPISAVSTTSASDGKIAIAYTGTTFVMYRNGVQILTTTSAIPSSMSAVRFNGRVTNDFYTTRKIKSAILFKTRLTNAELATLTTI